MVYVRKRLGKRVLRGKDALDANKVKVATQALTAIVITDGSNIDTGSRKMTVEEQAADEAKVEHAAVTTIEDPKLHPANTSAFGRIDGILMEAMQTGTSEGIDSAFREILTTIRSDPEAFRDSRLYQSIVAFGKHYRSQMNGTFSEFSRNGWNEENASLFGEILRETSPLYVVPK